MTQKKLDREAAERAAQNTIPATPSEADVFGTEQVRQVQKADENMIMVDKDTIANLIREVNELKSKDTAIDPSKKDNIKRSIRVGIYTHEDEKGKSEDYILTGLTKKEGRDGSIQSTWQRGRDEITDQIITWIQPILIGLDSGKTISPELRYFDFSNALTTIPLEIKHEEKVQVDMTPAPSRGVEVEQASYEDRNGYYKRQGSGVFVQLKAWGIQSTFTVEYEKKEYYIDGDVVNYK
jgi:hypothetical protein